MTEPPPAPLAESVALFERSAGYALESLSDVPAGDLDRPTPCTGWDLRRLVLHVADAADALTGLVSTGRLSFPEPPRRNDADPVAVARDRTQRLLDALRSATRRDTLGGSGEQAGWAGAAAQGGAIEFAAHGWDIASTCGTGRRIAGGLAAELLELAESLIDDRSRHPQFGLAVPVPPSATPSDRLVAFLGRQPAWRSVTGSSTSESRGRSVGAG